MQAGIQAARHITCMGTVGVVSRREPYVLTTGPRQCVSFGIGWLLSVTSVQCSQFMGSTAALLSRQGVITMEGHSNAECGKCKNNMPWETMRTNANCRLFSFLLLFRRDFDQNLK